MEDKPIDLPESTTPPIPPKTYRWEDVRRQKLEGSYPWTHLYKPPFDINDWENQKDNEYEPITPPMEPGSASTSPPRVTITGAITKNGDATNEQDKRYLHISDIEELIFAEADIDTDDDLDEDEDDVDVRVGRNGNLDDDEESDEEDDEDDSANEDERITARDLQTRLEEKFFSKMTSSGEYETYDSESSSVTSKNKTRNSESAESDRGLQSKMQSQADRIKQKFKKFREQHARQQHGDKDEHKLDNSADASPKRKSNNKDRFKFRLKKPNINLPDRSKFPSLPSISFPSFSRSRSNSVSASANDDRKSQCSSKTLDQPKKRFDLDFGTVPRIFGGKKKKPEEEGDYEYIKPGKNYRGGCKMASAPCTPAAKRKPFGQKWLGKFTDQQSREEDDETSKEIKKKLSEPRVSVSPTKGPIAVLRGEYVEDDTPGKPLSEIVDNKNFFFISLHEDRKDLKKLQEKLATIESKNGTESSRESLSCVEVERVSSGKPPRPEPPKTWKFLRSTISKLPKDEENNTPIPSNAGEGTNSDEENNPEIQEAKLEIMVKEKLPSSKNDAKEPLLITTRNKNTENEIELIRNKGRNVAFGGVNSSNNETESINISEIENSTPPTVMPRTKCKKKRISSDVSDNDSRVSVPRITISPEQEVIEVVTLATVNKTPIETITIVDTPNDSESDTNRFEEYENALGRNKLNTRYFSALEVRKGSNSSHNSLIRLGFDNAADPAKAPARPKRTRSFYRNKAANRFARRTKLESREETNGNNSNYNTFPKAGSVGPERPQRKPERPPRRSESRTNISGSVSSSINSSSFVAKRSGNRMNTNINNNTQATNGNMTRSKQLSISYLPLSINVVNETIPYYDLRETSSMIHLNIATPAPIPPRRKRSSSKSTINTVSRRNFGSKTSLGSFRSNFSHNFQDYDLEFADNTDTSLAENDIGQPPIPPRRRQSFSTTTSERRKPSFPRDFTPSSEYDRSTRSVSRDAGTAVAGKDAHGYAIVGSKTRNSKSDGTSLTFDSFDSATGNNNLKRSSSIVSETDASTLKRKIQRKLSDFFTVPRICAREDYIPPDSIKLDDDKRLPSPTRPPRNRTAKEPVYADNDSCSLQDTINSEFNLDDSDFAEDFSLNDDVKDLQSCDILEKMKGRPLPPPPRPPRKRKDDQDEESVKREETASFGYSKCSKSNEQKEETITTVVDNKQMQNVFDYVKPEKENSVERKILNITTRDNGRRVTSTQEIVTTASVRTSDLSVYVQTDPIVETVTSAHELTTKSEDKESVKSVDTERVQTNTSTTEANLDIVRAKMLQVNEMNVGKLNVSEIESSRIVASSMDTMSLHVSDIQSETGNLKIDAVELQQSTTPGEYIVETDSKEGSPPEDSPFTKGSLTTRLSRISSMIPEVGSDEEGIAIPPSRRKRQHKKQSNGSQTTNSDNNAANDSANSNISNGASSSTNRRQATVSELAYQILQICHSNVGQAVHAMVDQVIPESRDKRNEVQAAIWIITIIVAGCLVLGLGTDKTIHHHHWDFHFPPPH